MSLFARARVSEVRAYSRVLCSRALLARVARAPRAPVVACVSRARPCYMLARMLAHDFSRKRFMCLKHDNLFILLLHIIVFSMVIDPKFFVKSFNSEERLNFLFAEFSRKLDIMDHSCI